MTAIGEILCLGCGWTYDAFPPGCNCVECGGPVARYAGTLHVGQDLADLFGDDGEPEVRAQPDSVECL